MVWNEYLSVRLDDAVAGFPGALGLPCFRRLTHQSRCPRLEIVAYVCENMDGVCVRESDRRTTLVLIVLRAAVSTGSQCFVSCVDGE